MSLPWQVPPAPACGFHGRSRGVCAHARYPVGVAVEAERLPGGMENARRNADTTYIDLHHLYITQCAMLRNGVQVGEENLA